MLSPVHIPTASTPCEDCHSTTVFTAFSGTSMSSAKHTLMFAVIGSTCDACHNRVTPALNFYGVTNLQTRPTDHNSGNKATADCSSCHNPNNWDGGAQKRAKASTVIATAKALVPTAPASGASVRSTTTVNATAGAPAIELSAATGPQAGIRARQSAQASAFAHTFADSDCVSCHNGRVAAGKGAGHIASNESCGNCHTTMAWLPARFDHQGISARCASCHNAVLTAGKANSHIPTNLDCSNCHGTIAWRPARFSHAGAIGSCQSCHNALTGMGKLPGHVQTALDCGACHNTLRWTPADAPAPQRPVAPGPRGNHSGSGK